MATKPQQKQVRITQKQLSAARSKVKVDPRANEPREIDPEAYNSSLAKMLTFYRLEFDTKTKKQWAVAYFAETDKELSKTLSGISHQYFDTLGSLIRMEENGVVLSDSISVRIVKLATSISKITAEEVEVPQRTSVKPEQIDYFLGEFEGYVDDHLGKKNLSIVSWTRQFSPTLTQIDDLKSLIARKLAEFTVVLSDKELLAAYAISKKVCQDIVKGFTDALSELVIAYQRKPRIKKQVPIQKLVQGVKYLKGDTNLGLTSIDPSAIIGKDTLVTYNVKTRKVQYYVSGDVPFSIKGTTLVNFDEMKSIQKTLRNPKDQLLNLMQLGKRAFEKALSMIRSVDTIPTGRLNDDTLLCKLL